MKSVFNFLCETTEKAGCFKCCLVIYHKWSYKLCTDTENHCGFIWEIYVMGFVYI